MSFSDTIVEKYVDRAVAEFDTNALAKMFLRRLSNESPEQFLPEAMRHLRSSENSNALKFLAMLALRHEEVTGYLANPAVATAEIAQRLFKRFIEVDPSFDVRMARMLPDRSFTNHHVALSGARAIRALDILDRQSRGRRLLPILGHLPSAEDNKVAAKATLFVGSRVQSPEWVSRLLSRPDQRIRANAVESLWGVNMPSAIDLLEQCVEDKNNRVMGNALVGLHVVGHRSIDSELQSLSRNPSPDRRSTAAWAMGKVADGQWSAELTRLVKDEHPMVRGTALRSLLSLRRTEDSDPEAAAAEMAAAAPKVKQAVVELVAEVIQPSRPELRLDGSSFRARR
jgi:hypothetical protein